ncbi:MAG: multicopper oxidase [Bryobacterales bacterium]|nr:multicopper oxidase [Bryobacterales bacterium]
MDRRDFLKSGAVGLAASTFGLPRRALGAPLPGGTLNPTRIRKYVTPLAMLPAMPVTLTGGIDYYQIAVRQFQQQILPSGMPGTTVWSYGSVNHSESFQYPARTIEARVNRPVRVKWINGLVDGSGGFLPHLLPVDPTLHWANPPGPRDMHSEFQTTPGPYRGPVPMVTHLHGAHSTQESDGFPEAWYLPAAGNIPDGFYRVGSKYDEFKQEFESKWGNPWTPGSAVFQYANDQRPTTLWYHDHSLGMTRANVYAGPAGFYLIRDSEELRVNLPGPGPARGDAQGTRYYEIPIVIQDRSFNADGSLFYPDSRVFFDKFRGPYIPDSDMPPIWNPEVFGNTMVVNGGTWPVLDVEPRLYRFRFLNACNSRFLILKVVANPLAARPVPAALPILQIGADGGFLPRPATLPQLLMGPAERADVVVDFAGLTPGTEVYLINEAPDEPFGGGLVGDDFPAADPGTTGQVMKFRVVPLTTPDRSANPANLRSLPGFSPLPSPVRLRTLSLNEEDSDVLAGVGPRAAKLGILDGGGMPQGLEWMADVTENPRFAETETWELYNFTADAHPIHVHMVQFEIVNRQGLITDAEGMSEPPARLVGDPIPPEAGERGTKDTVIAYPGQVTRIKAKFDIRGLFVWHCHILEHEDNEMMRPYRVG